MMDVDFIREVQATKNGVWDAYDQGRLARMQGKPKSENPHRVHEKALGYHVNMGDWDRGWEYGTGQTVYIEVHSPQDRAGLNGFTMRWQDGALERYQEFRANPYEYERRHVERGDKVVVTFVGAAFVEAERKKRR